MRESINLIFQLYMYDDMSSSKTSSKTTTPKPKKEKEDNPSLVLAKNIADLTKALNSTGKAWDALQAARDEIETKFELEMRDRKRRFDESDADFEQKRKSRKVDLDLECKKYGRDKAVEILKATGEVPILQEELDSLKARAKKNEEELKQAVQEAVSGAKKSAERNAQRQSLEFDKKEAENKACITQLMAQCKQLQKQAADAQENLDKERQLMKDLVESMKSPAIIQNMGGK